MIQHHRLTLEEYPPSVGQPIIATIETARGIFVGLLDLRGIARTVVRYQVVSLGHYPLSALSGAGSRGHLASRAALDASMGGD